jgi:hypothetical protein
MHRYIFLRFKNFQFVIWLFLFTLASGCNKFEPPLYVDVFHAVSSSDEPFLPKKILVLGNSITWHGPDSSIGWSGSWGMAASSPQNEYLSILNARVKRKNEKHEVLGINVYPFERGFETIDLSFFKNLQDFEADVIIIRFGENVVEQERAKSPQFKSAIEKFIKYLSNGKYTSVYITTPFWQNDSVINVYTELAASNNWPLIVLHDLSLANENMALDKFANQSVGSHPGDLGMLRIADRIWAQLDKELP